MKSITLNNQQIAYRYRPGLVRTIVFANSLGSDQSIWDEVISNLPSGYGIVTLDLRGHGQSSVSNQSIIIDDLADDAINLIEALELKNIIFCGVSIGGMIGQSITARRPDLINGAILCNTAAKIGTAERWNERIEKVTTDGIGSISNAIISNWFGSTYYSSQADQVIAHENMLRSTSDKGYTMACEAIRDSDLSELSKSITTPTLCIGGSEDKSVPPDQVKALAELIPNAKLEILDAVGHLPCLEDPQKLTYLIEEFEQSLPQEIDIGTATRRAVLGDVHVDRAEAAKSNFDAAFQSLITSGAWGSVWSSPLISARERSMLTLALLAANGNFEEIPMHIRATVRTGASERDITQVFQHVAIYSGVPKANHGLKLAKATLAEMKASQHE